MTDDIRRLTDAVLYEGYILWPYRRSALKNQQRWTWGGVFPPSHNDAHPDDRASIRVDCLVEADTVPAVDVRVRFLQVVERALEDAQGRRVEKLEGHLAWDEAVERELVAGPGRTEIDIPAGRETEPLATGAIVRSWEALRGSVDVELRAERDGLFRLTVDVANETPWQGADREDALRHTFCSTHVVLHTEEGAFVSLTDPAEELRAAAEACDNVGVWPVLVGAEGERHTLFASPIILSDHPQIAPESPGDLFDAGEIDRLLILNVLSLTEAEQEEMRATDPRAREILDRCAALGPDELLPLHGALRDLGVSR
jgi:hydrogenase maturation protease